MHFSRTDSIHPWPRRCWTWVFLVVAFLGGADVLAGEPALAGDDPGRGGDRVAEAMAAYTVYDYLIGPGAKHYDRLHGSPFVPIDQPPIKLESQVNRWIWEGDFVSLRKESTDPMIAKMDETRDTTINLFTDLIPREMAEVVKQMPKASIAFTAAADQYLGSSHAVYGDKQLSGTMIRGVRVVNRTTQNGVQVGEDEELDRFSYFVARRLEPIQFGLLSRENIEESIPSEELPKTPGLNMIGALLGEEHMKKKVEPGYKLIRAIRVDMTRWVRATGTDSPATWQLTQNMVDFIEESPSIQERYQKWQSQFVRQHNLLPKPAYVALNQDERVDGALISPDLAGRMVGRQQLLQLATDRFLAKCQQTGIAEKDISKSLLTGFPITREDLKLVFESLGPTDADRRTTWNDRFGDPASVSGVETVYQVDAALGRVKGLQGLSGVIDQSVAGQPPALSTKGRAPIDGPIIARMILHHQTP